MSDMTDIKWCGKCKETKPFAEFSKDRSARDGLQGYCKPCHRVLTHA